MGTGLVVSGSVEAIESHLEQGRLMETPQMVIVKIRKMCAAQQSHAQVISEIYQITKI